LLTDVVETVDALPQEFKDRVRLIASTRPKVCGGSDMPTGATVFLRENSNLFNVAVARAAPFCTSPETVTGP
jgi:hypothetical protein